MYLNYSKMENAFEIYQFNSEIEREIYLLKGFMKIKQKWPIGYIFVPKNQVCPYLFLTKLIFY